MAFSPSITDPSVTGSGLALHAASTPPRSAELETALLSLPPYSPAFEPANWDDPEESLGSRAISPLSRGSARASLPVTSDGTYRILHVESGLEYNWALVIDGLLRPKYIVEQPETIEFIDFDGYPRRHTFDFYLETTTSRRIYIQVKPLAFVERDMWEATMGLIASQLPADAVDEVLLLTDADLHPDMIANAKLLRYVRRCPVLAVEDDLVDLLLEAGKPILTIGELVAASGLEGAGFVAVLRLIDHGRLIVLDEGRIGYKSRVRIARDLTDQADGLN